MKFKNYLNEENNELKTITSIPSKYSEEDIDKIIELIKKGGEVISSSLKSRVKKCKIITTCWDNKKLVGVIALKIPDDIYKENVFEKIGFPEESDNYKYELGYLFVDKKYRNQGISKMLLNNILKNNTSNDIFGTMREENKVIISIMKKYGWKKLGDSYDSARGDYKLVCYIST